MDPDILGVSQPSAPADAGSSFVTSIEAPPLPAADTTSDCDWPRRKRELDAVLASLDSR